MSDKDLNEKNVERACQDELTRRLLYDIIGKPPAELMRPHMRPHTWVFLRQKNNREEPVFCLGVVFHTWDRVKYNMVRFTAHSKTTDREITTSGRLTTLDNGETGLIIDKRWPWKTLLKEFRGLSAGDL